MKSSRIPTIIGILILMFGLATGVLLVQFRQVFKLGASQGASPKDVRIANISDTSVSISWLTENETSSFVKWGKSSDSLTNTATDEIGSQGFTHMVNLRGLTASANYFFKINSGGDDFDNNGTSWQFVTGTTLSPVTNPLMISGSVITASGNPSKNSLVYVSVSGTLLSTVSSQNGTWVIPLSSARASDLSGYLSIDPAGTLLDVSIEAGPDGVSQASVYPQSANPIPPMVLGQVYDLKNLPPNSSQGSSTNASVTLSQESTPSSRFQVPQGTASPSKAVTLDSVKSNEVVTTTKPEFFGAGPSGTTLSITLQSTPTSGSVKIASDGTWQWSPPTNLSPGTHTITLAWRDASGILRTLTRTFIVQASEGPAFESSPSASLTPSPTPTLSPTPTPTPTLKPTLQPTFTATPTSPPTPATGDLTSTLLLFIMGISTVGFSILLWKESSSQF